MSELLTASSITDPVLEGLLDELVRLRSALGMHAPRASEGEERATCRACATAPWPCPTVRAAYPWAALIAPQSGFPDPGMALASDSAGPRTENELIAPQSRRDAL
ncbi:hypothetical protein ABT224_20285 [Streptomyces sp. NPDC001584]|uniref:hypothetical protein n=1 Tax=Streptomyces sp. NPDC001584 TaxID=3154521 RepID=UPI003328C5B0